MKKNKTLKIALAGILICTTAAFAAGGGAIKGNPDSKVYHKAKCHHYAAKGSTAEFASEAAAEKEGYKACKQCGKVKTDKKTAKK